MASDTTEVAMETEGSAPALVTPAPATAEVIYRGPEMSYKNPVQDLNERRNGVGLDYEMSGEPEQKPDQSWKFTMVIEIDGIKFEGTGKNKKLAKAAAAKNALLKLYNVLNIEEKDESEEKTKAPNRGTKRGLEPPAHGRRNDRFDRGGFNDRFDRDGFNEGFGRGPGYGPPGQGGFPPRGPEFGSGFGGGVYMGPGGPGYPDEDNFGMGDPRGDFGGFRDRGYRDPYDMMPDFDRGGFVDDYRGFYDDERDRDRDKFGELYEKRQEYDAYGEAVGQPEISDTPKFSSKNPVQLLYEYDSEIKFELLEETTATKNLDKSFVIGADFGKGYFKGVGKNKKAAKADCAKNALAVLYNLHIVPEAELELYEEGSKTLKRPHSLGGGKPEKRIKASERTPLYDLFEIRPYLECYFISKRQKFRGQHEFTMGIEMDEAIYEGKGHTVWAAKVDAAEKCLDALKNYLNPDYAKERKAEIEAEEKKQEEKKLKAKEKEKQRKEERELKKKKKELEEEAEKMLEGLKTSEDTKPKADPPVEDDEGPLPYDVVVPWASDKSKQKTTTPTTGIFSDSQKKWGGPSGSPPKPNTPASASNSSRWGGQAPAVSSSMTGLDIAKNDSAPISSANKAPGFNQGNNAPGFNQGTRAPGFNQGTTAPGFNQGNNNPGFNQGNNATGFNQGHQEQNFTQQNIGTGFNQSNNPMAQGYNQSSTGGGYNQSSTMGTGYNQGSQPSATQNFNPSNTSTGFNKTSLDPRIKQGNTSQGFNQGNQGNTTQGYNNQGNMGQGYNQTTSNQGYNQGSFNQGNNTQGYNQSNVSNQQGYNQGNTGIQGYSQGTPGYDQGNTNTQGYNQGNTNTQGYNQGNANAQGYNQGTTGTQGYNQGTTGTQGYNQGTTNTQGYNQGSANPQAYSTNSGFNNSNSSGYDQGNTAGGFNQQTNATPSYNQGTVEKYSTGNW